MDKTTAIELLLNNVRVKREVAREVSEFASVTDGEMYREWIERLSKAKDDAGEALDFLASLDNPSIDSAREVFYSTCDAIERLEAKASRLANALPSARN